MSCQQKNKRALVFLSHGSRKSEANIQGAKICQQITQDLKNHYGYIESAYLELASPGFEESLLDCYEKGYRKIDCYLYFLALGNHVGRDIPAMVERFNATYPDCQVRVLGYLGQATGVATLVGSHIEQLI